jgi:hypothetical protein
MGGGRKITMSKHKAIAEVKALREHDEEMAMKHKKRHEELHKALDELFADFIGNHPDKTCFLQIPIIEIITWSKKQTDNPDHEG